MLIRSFKSLDFGIAWKRVLRWAQGGTTDSMDRLPFEVHDRLEGDAPAIRPEHHLSPVTVVMASKKSGTFRPFVRFEPTDLMLYQALVDCLAPAIEWALPSREHVMGYRQTLDVTAENPFAGSPSFAAYSDKVDALNAAQIPLLPASPFSRDPSPGPGFVLNTDLSGYFMHIDIGELERLLLGLEAASSLVVRDLGDLLRHWRLFGVRGLPQGVRASSPLANVYLAPLDALLAEMGDGWVRWMDDVTVTTKRYADARQILDTAERVLYSRGLSLNSAKTKIKRANMDDSPIPPDALPRRKEATHAQIAALIEAGYMDPSEAPEPAEIDEGLALEEVDELVQSVSGEDLPERFQSRMTSVLRDLEELKIARHLSVMPQVLTRAPDLSYVVLRYVAVVASQEVDAAVAVFLRVLGGEHYLREYEKLAVCRAALAMPSHDDLAVPFGKLAQSDPSGFVRARALLAWGAHSAERDFSIADGFWQESVSTWRAYPLVAIQRKAPDERDERYTRWSGEGRFLRRLAEELRVAPIKWTRT